MLVVVGVVRFVLVPVPCVVVCSISFKPCLNFLMRFAMLLRGFGEIGRDKLDRGEMGEAGFEADGRRNRPADTSSSSWIAGFETDPSSLESRFLVAWASEKASAIFNSVSPLTENPMPEAPLPAVAALILKPFPFTLPCSRARNDACGAEFGYA